MTKRAGGPWVILGSKIGRSWTALISFIQPEGIEISAIDRLLASARSRIEPRLAATELDDAISRGDLVIDTRPSSLRERDGSIEGAVVVERNVLEWRLDPTGDHHLSGFDDPDRRVIIVCDEGYASSLAAASLRDLGLSNVTDLEGGFQAWRSLHTV